MCAVCHRVRSDRDGWGRDRQMRNGECGVRSKKELKLRRQFFRVLNWVGDDARIRTNATGSAS